ncbi:MAG TPA: helix-turn-helix domain-containing protein [Atribacteraceae bacterium]|nr:helix-turn-helix domain-containing protein [Atribacteraceae bacterium]
MKKLQIDDVETFIAAIEDEISYTTEGRYYHRLHVALHALKTGDGYESARIYNHSPVSVYNWVHRLVKSGLAGLQEGVRCGRSSKLSESQEAELRKDLLIMNKRRVVCGYSRNIKEPTFHQKI